LTFFVFVLLLQD